jgi:membrane protease YdiL (CAAX protease family)
VGTDTGAPAPGWRVVLSVVALGAGILVAATIGGGVIAAGGWDFDVASDIGNDFGRVVGQWGLGQPLDHNRIPLVVSVVLNIPLWAMFIGIPWLAVRRRGLDWRRDLGWGMRPIDVPAGLAIGVVTQVLLVPLLYVPILEFVDDADLEEPARNLVASATSPVGVAALVVLTVIGAPIAEEILFRGLLFRGLADIEAGRRFGITLAVVASSAVFAISHLQLLQFPGLFLIGAIAATAMHRTGRLGTAIWIHAGFNATTVTILLAEIY